MPNLKKKNSSKKPLVFVAFVLLLCILSLNLFIATNYTSPPNMPYEVIVDKDVIKEVMGVGVSVLVEDTAERLARKFGLELPKNVSNHKVYF
jgi:hypothetical protein